MRVFLSQGNDTLFIGDDENILECKKTLKELYNMPGVSLDIGVFTKHKVPGNTKIMKLNYYQQNGTRYIQVFTQSQSPYYFPKNQRLVALFDMDTKHFIRTDHLHAIGEKASDDQSFLMCPLTDALFVKHDFKVSKYTLELSDDKKTQRLVLKGIAIFNDLIFPINGAHGDSLYFGN